jgi:uncharacterized membrane protein YbhN (UPF0104 family)
MKASVFVSPAGRRANIFTPACLAPADCQKNGVRLTPFLQSPAGTVLRYGLSVAVLAVLAAQVNWVEFHGLRRLDWSLAGPAVLLAGLAYPLQAWRWQALLTAQDIRLPVPTLHRVFWIAQFFNSFLPGGVAGDAVRFGHLWRAHPDRKAAAAASLIADRLLGLGALFALAALALGLHLALTGGGAELQTLLAASLAAFGLLLAGGWIATRTVWWQPLCTRLLGPERTLALHEALGSLGRRHGVLAVATALSLGVWLLDFAALWLLARSVGLVAGPLVICAAGAAAYVAATLPISIGGHGVREGALVATLSLLGVSGQGAGSLAMLALAFWAISIGWSLVGGVVFLFSTLRPGTPRA